MAKLEWDNVGERFYQTGVDRVVLYPESNGAYPQGVAWSGVTAINENPSGAEANALYADNIKYLNMISNEDFACGIEAYYYPDEFADCDGSKEFATGIRVTQQTRKMFGLSYRTLIGNDSQGTDYGYEIHLVYGCNAAPSSKSRNTVNENPEAATMSWEVSTTPISVGEGFKPTAHIVLNSIDLGTKLAAVEEALYGGTGDQKVAHLPLPAELLTLVS